MSPSAMKKNVSSRRKALQCVESGLNGDQFYWNLAMARPYTKMLKEMGITLVSESWCKRNGYRLKRNTEPVGKRYYGAPISAAHPVYVLECQCVKQKKD